MLLSLQTFYYTGFKAPPGLKESEAKAWLKA